MRLLIAVASPVAEPGLSGAAGSVVGACGLSSRGSWALEHKLTSCGTDLVTVGPFPIRNRNLVSSTGSGPFTTEPAEKHPQSAFKVYQRRHRWRLGLPWWLRQSRICLQCRRPGFDPWVGKIPWRRDWLLTPVSLPAESHRQRSLAGYSLWVTKSWKGLSN